MEIRNPFDVTLAQRKPYAEPSASEIITDYIDTFKDKPAFYEDMKLKGERLLRAIKGNEELITTYRRVLIDTNLTKAKFFPGFSLNSIGDRTSDSYEISKYDILDPKERERIRGLIAEKESILDAAKSAVNEAIHSNLVKEVFPEEKREIMPAERSEKKILEGKWNALLGTLRAAVMASATPPIKQAIKEWEEQKANAQKKQAANTTILDTDKDALQSFVQTQPKLIDDPHAPTGLPSDPFDTPSIPGKGPSRNRPILS